jgi:hypothetical protein
MGYVRITIQLRNGHKRSGVRAFTEPMNLEDIRKHAFHLSAEALGRGAIDDVEVHEVPATDPAVVAMISKGTRGKSNFTSDGTHPYVKQQQRRPLH